MSTESDKHYWAKRFVRGYCLNMTITDVDWAAASDPTDHYNCFGFCMGRLAWWEPENPDDDISDFSRYWPEGISNDLSVDSYVEAAKTEGFFVSPDGAWEQAFETIVLYYTQHNRDFHHAARLKYPGTWESKLGIYSDFEHTPDGLDNIKYGQGRIFMKRRWPHTSTVVPQRLSPTETK